MAGRIQNEDVKTLAEVGSVRSRLTHDSKIYISALSLGKTLEEAIEEGYLGTGDSPLRMYAANPADAKLYFRGSKVVGTDGASRAVAPIDDLDVTTADGWFDFQALLSSGPSFEYQGAQFLPPVSTTGYVRRFCFSLLSTGVINVNYSDEATHTSLLPDVGSLFSVIEGQPIGFIDLECIGSQDFKTAGSSTSVIEAKVDPTYSGTNARLGSTFVIAFNDNNLVGTNWYPSVTEEVTEIAVNLSNPLAVSGNVSITIYSTSIHDPDTPLALSDPVDATTIGATEQQVIFTFSTPVNLSSGIRYSFVLANDASGLLQSHAVGGAFPTERLVFSSDGGASWNDDSVSNLYYIINPNLPGSRIFWYGSGSGGSAGSVKDFKIQSVTTPNAIIKGGYLKLASGPELATWDGAGSASSDFGKDITVNLTTILGASPAANTTYHLYFDKNAVSLVTMSDMSRTVYPVSQASLKLFTTGPESINRARYVWIGLIQTDGASLWGQSSGFKTAATKMHWDGPVSINPKVYSLSQAVGSVGSVGQIAAGHALSSESFPSALGASSRVWYPLEVSGAEGSSNAINLTNNGSIAFTGTDLWGNSNKAANLDGVNDSFDSTSVLFNPGNAKPFAVGGWVALTDWTPSGAQYLFAQQSATGDRGFGVYVTSAGNIVAVGTNTAGSHDTTLTVTNPGFVNGSWQHIVLLYDYAASTLKLFINGKLTSSSALANVRTVTSARFRIGAQYTVAQDFAAGRFREFFFVNNYLLSEDDIRKLMSSKITHNKNIQAKNQDWKVVLSTPQAFPNIMPIVDQSDSNNIYVDFSDMESTDTVDLALLDMGMSPAAVPAVPPFDQTYTSNPTFPLTHGQVEVPRLVVMAKDASNDWHTMDAAGLIKADSTQIKGSVQTLFDASYTAVRIIALVGNSPTGVKEAESGSPGILAYANQEKFIEKISLYTAVKGDKILANSSGGVFTINLPASPAVGDHVEFFDAQNSWGTNAVTIGRNGSNINAVAADYSLNVSGAKAKAVYVGGSQGWRIYE